jgi:hypothetical protein
LLDILRERKFKIKFVTRKSVKNRKNAKVIKNVCAFIESFSIFHRSRNKCPVSNLKINAIKKGARAFLKYIRVFICPFLDTILWRGPQRTLFFVKPRRAHCSLALPEFLYAQAAT